MLLVVECGGDAPWMVVPAFEADLTRMRSTIIFILILAVAAAHAAEVPMIMNRRHDVPLIDVKVNGKVARFILDTGSANTLIADDLAGGTAPGPSGFRPDRNGFEVHGRWWEVDLEVAGRRWPRRTVGIVDLSRVREHYGKDISGLLGQDVLREFDSVRIDYRRKKVEME